MYLRDTARAMSENLDLVRSIYADWERGDFSRSDWAHPEIEYVYADGPEPGRWIGLANMADAWRARLSALEDFRFVVNECHEIGNERVLVLIGARGHFKASGLSAVDVPRFRRQSVLESGGSPVAESVQRLDHHGLRCGPTSLRLARCAGFGSTRERWKRFGARRIRARAEEFLDRCFRDDRFGDEPACSAFEQRHHKETFRRSHLRVCLAVRQRPHGHFRFAQCCEAVGPQQPMEEFDLFRASQHGTAAMGEKPQERPAAHEPLLCVTCEQRAGLFTVSARKRGDVLVRD
jgi:ketosteroid isomerase-like protein